MAPVSGPFSLFIILIIIVLAILEIYLINSLVYKINYSMFALSIETNEKTNNTADHYFNSRLGKRPGEINRQSKG